MKVFPLPEFTDEKYRETLFAELIVVDHRNPELVAREPIPPASRVLAHRSAAQHTIWPAHKLDGSPDLRYNPLTVGGGDQWIPLSRLVDHLERARSLGDIFPQQAARAASLMAMKWRKGERLADAALLTSLQGWSVPVYFLGAFQDFSMAVERLVILQAEIASGAVT